VFIEKWIKKNRNPFLSYRAGPVNPTCPITNPISARPRGPPGRQPPLAPGIRGPWRPNNPALRRPLAATQAPARAPLSALGRPVPCHSPLGRCRRATGRCRRAPSPAARTSHVRRRPTARPARLSMPPPRLAQPALLRLPCSRAYGRNGGVSTPSRASPSGRPLFNKLLPCTYLRTTSCPHRPSPAKFFSTVSSLLPCFCPSIRRR
jgi:hypothetical protein